LPRINGPLPDLTELHGAGEIGAIEISGTRRRRLLLVPGIADWTDVSIPL
jgi:hypothetical protein